MRGAAVFLALAVLTGAGCVATGTSRVSKGGDILAKSPHVVSSFAQLAYQDIRFGEPAEVIFNEDTPVLQLGEERRFAKGFVLPREGGAYSVSIISYKEGTLYDPAIMYPEVRILDEKYRTVRTLSHESFVFRTLRSAEGLNAVFFVNGTAKGERFLLITNRSLEEADLIVSQANITSATAAAVPVNGGFFMWMIPTGSNTPPIKMKASPMGKLEVTAEKYSPKRVGQ